MAQIAMGACLALAALAIMVLSGPRRRSKAFAITRHEPARYWCSKAASNVEVRPGSRMSAQTG